MIQIELTIPVIETLKSVHEFYADSQGIVSEIFRHIKYVEEDDKIYLQCESDDDVIVIIRILLAIIHAGQNILNESLETNKMMKDQILEFLARMNTNTPKSTNLS